MVELRSGKCIDLGLLKKTSTGRVTRADRRTTASSRTTKQTKIEMSLEFDIYEDDPLAERPDLVSSPLNCQQAAAVDKENEEPDFDAPSRSHRTRELSAQADLSRNGRVRMSTLTRGLPGRPALHQILHDEQYQSGRPTQIAEATSSSKESAAARDRATSKLANPKPDAQLAHSAAKNSFRSTQPGLKRVSMLDLR